MLLGPSGSGKSTLLNILGGLDVPSSGSVQASNKFISNEIKQLGSMALIWTIIDITSPPEQQQTLGDAYRVEARIVLWKGDNVLKVPAGALFRQGKDWAVYVIADGRAELRLVQVGHTSGLETEITGGLAEGEQVVLHPSDKIQGGVQVYPR